MPAYTHLISEDIDFEQIQSRVDGMAMLGVPYGDAVNKAPDMAREQAKTIAADLAQTGGGNGFETKEVTALIAYMQRLGRDIQVPSGAVAVKPVLAPSVVPAGGHP
jgi:cytochrome c oxidase cbb3-type subunit I/II